MATAIIKGVSKEAAQKLLDDSQKVIKEFEKGNLKELTPRENLLKKPSTKTLEVEGKPKKKVFDDETSETVIRKEDFKVKKPKIDEAGADDILEARRFKLLDNKIGREILTDFNINKINDEKDIAEYIELISQKYAKQFNKQKRGIKTNQATKRLATMVSENPEKLTATLLNLKPGQTLNAEYILAARELLVAGMNKLDDLARVAVKGDEKQILEFRQHMALMSHLQKVIKGVQTETARALQQFKIPTRNKAYTNINLDALNTDDLYVKLGGDSQKNVARLYLDTRNTKEALQFTEGAGLITNVSKASDSIAEIFLNAILSNPITHLKNTGGNWLTQGIVAYERRVAAKTFGGKDIDGVAEFEDIAKAYGKSMVALEMSAAMSRSLKGKNIFQKPGAFFEGLEGLKSDVAGSKVEIRQGAFTADNFNAKKGTFTANTVDAAGKLLTLNRIPTRMLTAADTYFKNLEYRSELYAQAYRETVKKIRLGELEFDDASAYLADAIVNPSEASVKAAYDAAHYVTYQTRLNTKSDHISKLGAGLQNIKNKSGWFSWLSNYYLPFVQTPTNIATFVSERTPGLNLLLKSFYEDIAAGGARKQLALTKLKVGSQFYMATAPLGALGYNYGSGPNLKTKGKGTLKQTLGYQDKTIQIPYGDKMLQIKYEGGDPFAMMFAQSADLGRLGIDIYRDPTEWQKYTALAIGMTLSFGENLINSTYMQGANQALEDFQLFKYGFENEKLGEATLQWGKQVGAKFMPGSGFLKFGSKVLGVNDNYKKIAIEFDELLQRNIYENNLKRDYDLRGRPLQKYGYFTTRPKQDPLDQELEKVNPTITPFSRKINVSLGPKGVKETFPVTLESDELSFLKYSAGKISDFRLNNLIKNPAYKNAPAWLKGQLIEKEVQESRKLARQQLLQDKESRERIYARGMEKFKTKLLNEETRANDNIDIDNQE